MPIAYMCLESISNTIPLFTSNCFTYKLNIITIYCKNTILTLFLLFGGGASVTSSGVGLIDKNSETTTIICHTLTKPMIILIIITIVIMKTKTLEGTQQPLQRRARGLLPFAMSVSVNAFATQLY